MYLYGFYCCALNIHDSPVSSLQVLAYSTGYHLRIVVLLLLPPLLPTIPLPPVIITIICPGALSPG